MGTGGIDVLGGLGSVIGTSWARYSGGALANLTVSRAVTQAAHTPALGLPRFGYPGTVGAPVSTPSFLGWHRNAESSSGYHAATSMGGRGAARLRGCGSESGLYLPRYSGLQEPELKLGRRYVHRSTQKTSGLAMCDLRLRLGVGESRQFTGAQSRHPVECALQRRRAGVGLQPRIHAGRGSLHGG